MKVRKQINIPAFSFLSQSQEWETPSIYVNVVRDFFNGTIELDPASNYIVNGRIQAKSFYGLQEDHSFICGLRQDWNALSIFCNPPYGMNEVFGKAQSSQSLWSRKAWFEFRKDPRKEIILLVNSETSAQWFQPLWLYPLCFTNHRIRFIPMFDSEKKNQPTKGSAFVCFTNSMNRADRFKELFSQFGRVIIP